MTTQINTREETNYACWVTQITRNGSKNVTPAIAYVDSQATANTMKDIFKNGATLDSYSLHLNEKFVRSTGSTVTKCTFSKKYYDTKAEFHGYTLDRKTSRDVILWLPIRLLHTPRSYSKLEGLLTDVHERVLFRGLHMWDKISTQTKQEIFTYIDSDMPKTLKAISTISKEVLLTCLFYARGKYLKETPHYPTNTQEYGLHDDMRCVFHMCTCCDDNHYMNKLYEKAYTDTNDFFVFLNADHGEINASMQADTFLILINTVMTYINYGMLVVPRSRLTVMATKPRAEVYFIIDKHSVDIMRSNATVGPGMDGQLAIRCNHEKLSEVIERVYHCTKNTSLPQNPLNIHISLEDNNIPVLNMNEEMLLSRLAELHEMEKLSAHVTTRRFVTLLDSTYPPVCELQTLAEKVAWVAFELMYNQNINTLPRVSQKRMPFGLEEQRQRMTFGIAMERDAEWWKHEHYAELFFVALRAVKIETKADIMADLVREEEDEKIASTKKQVKLKKHHKPKSGARGVCVAKEEDEEEQEEKKSEHNEDDYMPVMTRIKQITTDMRYEWEELSQEICREISTF